MVGFYDWIKIIAVSLLCYPFDCVYRLFKEHFENDNKAIWYNSEKAAFQDNKIYHQ